MMFFKKNFIPLEWLESLVSLSEGKAPKKSYQLLSFSKS